MLPRRRSLGLLLAGGLMFPSQGSANDQLAGGDPGAPGGMSMWTMPRTLWLRRPGVRGGDLRVTYWANGQIHPEGYRAACVYLRDVGFERAIIRGDRRILDAVRAGRLPQEIPIAAPISLRVLDALFAIGQWLAYFGMARPIIVTSAFRHAFYNNVMVEGSAKDGMHTEGRAVDVLVEGVSPDRIAQFSRWLGVGGVGLYLSRGFLHIDDGPLRSWKGR